MAYRKSAFTCKWCGRPITLNDMPCSVVSEAERQQRASTTSDVVCQRELHESGFETPKDPRGHERPAEVIGHAAAGRGGLGRAC